MNVLMINPVHPRTPHISAVRAWRFSQELAGLGHRVVLLTKPLAGQVVGQCEDMARHDWKLPFVLPCSSMTAAHANVTRPAGLLGKLATAGRMLWQGGADGAWVRAAAVTTGRLRQWFEPDAIWCTFGKMEAVFAARRIAASAGCPWVLDIKDNWELYVPRGLRRLMVWRTRGWSAVTANAEFTGAKARRWQRTEATVIYSGVDDAFYDHAAAPAPSGGGFQINLVGSLYHREYLRVFLQGLRRWAEGIGQSVSGAVALCYMGADGTMLDEMLRRNDPGVRVRRLGYVGVGEMALNCQQGALNAYIAHSGTFHHKLLELLACGRPLLAVPQEDEESRHLVRTAGGCLFETADEAAVEAGLERVHRDWLEGAANGTQRLTDRQHSWRNQAMRLETVLNEVIATYRERR